MNLLFASTAELYAEHRRTASPKKKLKIAAELQRRHDETYTRSSRPANVDWYFWTNRGFIPYRRYNFALLLP